MEKKVFDVAIIGAGVSGSFIAKELCSSGIDCLMIEAGTHFKAATYPSNEMDANSRLYWSGGIELNTDADQAFLRPKVVGGGSIMNQALVDRFDEIALDDFAKDSGFSYFNSKEMDSWYSKAEAELCMQEIPEEYWNDNVRIFRDGFDNNGFKWAKLRRAQANCKYEDGTDCIECLAGCPLDSKQSMPVTVLKKALKDGLQLISDCEVDRIAFDKNPVSITLKYHNGKTETAHAKTIIMAAGAIGNSALLQKSGVHHKLPAIGKGFFSHPQEMVMGIYEREINAHKNGFQALKSDDPKMREDGYKLENIFAPPVSMAMLMPGFGTNHSKLMHKIRNLGCLEVAVRDTNPGTITVNRNGVPVINKVMNEEDKRRRQRGLTAIDKILKSTGAKEIIPGGISIGLHLIGGCAFGTDPKSSVVGEDFRMHGHKNVFIADSSTFPNAPGQNPSLTIMAISTKAAQVIKEHVKHN